MGWGGGGVKGQVIDEGSHPDSKRESLPPPPLFLALKRWRTLHLLAQNVTHSPLLSSATFGECQARELLCVCVNEAVNSTGVFGYESDTKREKNKRWYKETK